MTTAAERPWAVGVNKPRAAPPQAGPAGNWTQEVLVLGLGLAVVMQGAGLGLVVEVEVVVVQVVVVL